MKLFERKSKSPNDLVKDASLDLLRQCQEELEGKNTKIKEQETEIIELKKGNLPKTLVNFKNIWIQKHIGEIDNNYTHFDDPVHGHICIENTIAPIFFEPIVQRLNYIKQLSFSYFAYPTATHTRMAHSLGTARGAEAALETIFRRGVVYTDKGKEEINLTLAEKEKEKIILTAKIAGLLHDIGHGPFGHGLDRFIGFKYLSKEVDQISPDKHYSIKYIEEYLSDVIEKCGIDVKNISNVLGKDKLGLDGYYSLIGDIVDSSVDVDRMDYLLRDAHLTGLSLGTLNAKTLIAYMAPYKKDDRIYLTYHEDAIPYIEHFMYAHDAMYINCYEHPTKIAAERMLVKAVENFMEEFKVLENKIDDLLLLTDEQLLDAIMYYSDPSMDCYKLINGIRTRNLPSKVYELHVNAEGASSEVRSWIKIVTMGRRKEGYIDKPLYWEKTLAESIGLKKDEFWKVLITLPPLDAYEQKEEATKILSPDGDGFKINELNNKSELLKGINGIGFKKLLNNARLKIRVFASNELPNEKRNQLCEEAKRSFES